MWEPLLRWLDPIEHRRRQEDRRKKQDAENDVDYELVPPPPKTRVVARVCRVCGYGDDLDHRFCPRCLAETMADMPRSKKNGNQSDTNR